MNNEAPEGYRYEWKEDPRWKYDPGKYRVCRQPHCSAMAVAALNRGIRIRTSTERNDSWWYYCADHLYGRRITDGKVMSRYLMKNADVVA